jgi:hypothetical protein
VQRSGAADSDVARGIPSRHTCSRMAMTSGLCRRCSGTRTSARRWYTRTSSIVVRLACAAPSIASDGTGQDSVGRERLRLTTGRRAFGTTRELDDVQQVDRRAVGPRSPWLAASARVQSRRSRSRLSQSCYHPRAQRHAVGARPSTPPRIAARQVRAVYSKSS